MTRESYSWVDERLKGHKKQGQTLFVVRTFSIFHGTEPTTAFGDLATV